MVDTVRSPIGSALIPTERLESARAWHDHGLGAKLLNVLLKDADQTIKSPPPPIGAARPVNGCFQVQNRLLHLAAASILTDEDRYFCAALDTVEQLTKGKWNSTTLNDEVRVSYALSGLAAFFDLTRPWHTSFQSEMIYTTALEMADWLYDGRATFAYGHNRPETLAWNHSVVPAAAVSTFAVIFPRCPRAAEMKRWGDERIIGYLKNGISPEGAAREGLFYAGFVFRILGIYWQIARGLGLFDYTNARSAVPYAKLRRVPNWYLHNIFPSGCYLHNHNDSTSLPHYPMFGWLLTFGQLRPRAAAAIWNCLIGDRGLRRYGRDASMSAASSFEAVFFYPFEYQNLAIADLSKKLRHTFFSKSYGVLYNRSGWNKTDSVFTFKSSPHLHGIHGQSDANSFTFLGNGVPLIIDSGAHNQPKEGSRSSSYGHNAVLIDGCGQRPGGRGNGGSGRVIYYREFGEDRLLCLGDAATAYGSDNYNPVLRAYRYAFVGWSPRPFTLICDDIAKDREIRNYEFILQTPDFDPEWISDRGFGGRIRFGGQSSPLTVHCVEPAIANIRYQRTHIPLPFKTRMTWFLSAVCEAPNFVILIVSGSRAGFTIASATKGDLTELSIHWEEGLVDKISLANPPVRESHEKDIAWSVHSHRRGIC